MQKLPKGSKIIVPIDTNILNLMIECKYLFDKSTQGEEINPLTIPNSSLSSHTKIDKHEAERLDMCKIVAFSLYTAFRNGDAVPFVSPTVFNEIMNISDKKADFKAECLRFIKSFAVMPAIEIDGQGNLSLAGQKEAEELAYKYCEPYDYTYYNKAGDFIKAHSDIGAMKWNTSPHILSSSNKPKQPQADAYVVAYPAVFRLSLLTLNSCDMIDDSFGDGVRRNGIKCITSQYLGIDFKQSPSPYHPIDIFHAIRPKTKQSTPIDLTPFDYKEFLRVLSIKFGKLDLAFTDKASLMLEILDITVPEEQSNQYLSDDDDYTVN